MMTSQAVALLLAVAVVPSNGSDWGRVQQLKAGSRIVVTAHGRQTPDEQYVVEARAESITLFEPSTLPKRVRPFVTRFVLQHPDFVGARAAFVEGGLSLTSDGVFAGGTRLAELAEFMPTISRGDVAEVIQPARGASGALVTAAVAGGIVVGVMAATAFLSGPCYGNCKSNEVESVASGLGIPIAAGFLAARGTRRKAEVIYQAPSEPGGDR
jgi:hypothetical protein